MKGLQEVPVNKIYHVSIVENIESIDWRNVEKANMTPRPEKTIEPPYCYGQLVYIKNYGFVCRLASDDKNPVTHCTEEDGGVCNDSALEFFVQFGQSDYLNIELNCNGVSHQKCGPVDGKRLPVAEHCDERFVVKTHRDKNGWDAIIYLPFEKLERLYPSVNFDNIETGFVFRGNFYTMTSHDNHSKYYYCQWVDTETPKPQYHVPDKFGYFVID